MFSEKSHSFDNSVVRHDEFCGVYEETLHPADAESFGKVLASLLRSRQIEGRDLDICLGYDCRLSSLACAESMVRGMFACGAKILVFGQIPAPLLAFYERELHVAAAVMISGNSRSARYNGFQVIVGGHLMRGRDLTLLARMAQSGNYTHYEDGEVLIAHGDLGYADRLLLAADFGSAEPHAIWDAGGGTCGKILMNLLPQLPGRHQIIGGDVDGHFRRRAPNPLAAGACDALQRAVLEADSAPELGAHEEETPNPTRMGTIGLALSEDGRRLAAVDEAGRVVSSDRLMTILHGMMDTDSIILDGFFSRRLEQHLASQGKTTERVHAHAAEIFEHMLTTGSKSGFSRTGELFFRSGWYGFSDGIHSALWLLTLLAKQGEALAALVDALPSFYQTPLFEHHSVDGSLLLARLAHAHGGVTRARNEAGAITHVAFVMPNFESAGLESTGLESTGLDSAGLVDSVAGHAVAEVSYGEVGLAGARSLHWQVEAGAMEDARLLVQQMRHWLRLGEGEIRGDPESTEPEHAQKETPKAKRTEAEHTEAEHTTPKNHEAEPDSH